MTSSPVVSRPMLRSALRIVRCALCAGVAAACASGGSAGAGGASNPDAKEWIDLFNGRNLDGWIPKFAKHEVGENFANTFQVKDGIITARYDGYGGDYNVQFGHLYYEKPYSYYLVSMEYRFVGELYPKAPSYTIRNSGVMIHSQDPRTMPKDQNFPISIEMQFLGGLSDGKPRTTGNMCSPGTAVEFNGKFDPRHCINSTSKTYDGEQWVKAEALVLGDSIVKQIINGDTVLVYTKPQHAAGVVTGFDPAQLHVGQTTKSGYIALQAEGHPVDFRNVRLLNLEGCMDSSSPRYKRYYIKSNPAGCR